MRRTTLVIFTFTISLINGCATHISAYENPTTGKVGTCRATGTGIIGMVGAADYMDKCKETARRLGYTKTISEM